MKEKIKLAPSILSADFARFGDQVSEATRAGADYIHVDVMDGQFVPPITFGDELVSAIRPYTDIPLDVHLMIASPERQIESFAAAGADIITVHVEACTHLHRVVTRIRELNVKAGVSLNPATPLETVTEILSEIDLLLVMTVNPGYGGQGFIRGVLDKISRARQLLDEKNLPVELEVDGGVNEATAPDVIRAGGRVLVAGSAVFNKKESVPDAMERIRNSAGYSA
ncbi:MAG: ribulose-phosphate 3-epimerase [Dehalococcoidia bacterium]